MPKRCYRLSIILSGALNLDISHSVSLYLEINADFLFTSFTWLRSWLWAGEDDVPPKRQLDDGETNQFRKKKIRVAVNDVEVALARLKEVTSTVNLHQSDIISKGPLSEEGENVKNTLVALTRTLKYTDASEPEKEAEKVQTVDQLQTSVEAESDERQTPDHPSTLESEDIFSRSSAEISYEQSPSTRDLNDSKQDTVETEELFYERHVSPQLGYSTTHENDMSQIPNDRSEDEEIGSDKSNDQNNGEIEIDPKKGTAGERGLIVRTALRKRATRVPVTSYVVPISSPPGPPPGGFPVQSHTSTSTSPHNNGSPDSVLANLTKSTFHDNISHVRPFAVERFPEFVTPRSPARQSRLEHRRTINRRLCDDISTSEEPIYLPRLKTTSSHGSDIPALSDSVICTNEQEAKVWDAKILKSDRWGVYLSRNSS
jgi:hypothetical protein